MKLSKVEKEIIRCAKVIGHTVYACRTHGLFSNSTGSNKCPYCGAVCETFKEEEK